MSNLDSEWRGGFWLYTSERFLYLQDLMVQYGLKNVFHLEHDNLLYTNIEDLLFIFKNNYPGLGLTMHNDHVCIPGFVYIANEDIMTQLATFFANNAWKNLNDMQILGLFKNEKNNEYVKNLPIIFREYAKDNQLKNAMNHIPQDEKQYYLNINQFESIFDGAAIGQYLGGIDPIHYGYSEPGFINESCIFNPSLLTYKWIEDDKERMIPFVFYENKKFRINNLHIHSKDLKKFVSKKFD